MDKCNVKIFFPRVPYWIAVRNSLEHEKQSPPKQQTQQQFSDSSVKQQFHHSLRLLKIVETSQSLEERSGIKQCAALECSLTFLMGGNFRCDSHKRTPTQILTEAKAEIPLHLSCGSNLRSFFSSNFSFIVRLCAFKRIYVRSGRFMRAQLNLRTLIEIYVRLEQQD